MDNNRIMATLENLEDKIENIKWLLAPLYMKKTNISESINLVRRTAGILGKDSPKGTVFENKVRREWKVNFSKRIK